MHDGGQVCMVGRGHTLQEGVCVCGGGHVWQRGVCVQETRPLKRAVRIPLECIVVIILFRQSGA